MGSVCDLADVITQVGDVPLAEWPSRRHTHIMPEAES